MRLRIPLLLHVQSAVGPTAVQRRLPLSNNKTLSAPTKCAVCWPENQGSFCGGAPSVSCHGSNAGQGSPPRITQGKLPSLPRRQRTSPVPSPSLKSIASTQSWKRTDKRRMLLSAENPIEFEWVYSRTPRNGHSPVATAHTGYTWGAGRFVA